MIESYSNRLSNTISGFLERKWEASILENGREREFPLTPGSHQVTWAQAVASCRDVEEERVVQVLVLATELESGLENFLHLARGLRLPGKW